jgi:TonB family protein
VRRRYRWPVLVLGAALACGRGAPPPPDGSATPPPPAEEPPVALNPDPPIQYPPRLYDQQVEGNVVLRLFVDSTGKLIPESTRVAEPSGYPALDSAATAGAAKLRFAPAKRYGIPVSTLFLQPIEFHHGAVETTAPAPGTVTTLPTPSPTPPSSRPSTTAAIPRARRRSPAIRPDTIKPRADTAKAQLDSAKPRADTAKARPDSGKPPRDTNVVAH